MIFVFFGVFYHKMANIMTLYIKIVKNALCNSKKIISRENKNIKNPEKYSVLFITLTTFFIFAI